MSERSCTRGEPEIVFSFDDKGEIVLDVESSTMNGWKITPFQEPCKVVNSVIIIIQLSL